MQQSKDVWVTRMQETTLPTLKTLSSQNIQSTKHKSLSKKSELKASKIFRSCTIAGKPILILTYNMYI